MLRIFPLSSFLTVCVFLASEDHKIENVEIFPFPALSRRRVVFSILFTCSQRLFSPGCGARIERKIPSMLSELMKSQGKEWESAGKNIYETHGKLRAMTLLLLLEFDRILIRRGWERFLGEKIERSENETNIKNGRQRLLLLAVWGQEKKWKWENEWQTIHDEHSRHIVKMRKAGRQAAYDRSTHNHRSERLSHLTATTREDLKFYFYLTWVSLEMLEFWKGRRRFLRQHIRRTMRNCWAECLNQWWQHCAIIHMMSPTGIEGHQTFTSTPPSMQENPFFSLFARTSTTSKDAKVIGHICLFLLHNSQSLHISVTEC